MVALFVVLMFIFFILIDFIVLRAEKKTHPAFSPSSYLAGRLVFDLSTLMVPADIFISKGHTWAKKNEYGLIKIGVDDFVIKSLGNFSVSEVAEPGTNVKKGDIIFEGISNGTNFKFRSPVDGEVKFTNPNIIGKMIHDPYGDDWSILMLAPQYEISKYQLYSGDAVKTWMKKEFRRLREFLGAHTVKPELAGVTMQDGGNIVEGALSMVSSEGIKDFENEFLLM